MVEDHAHRLIREIRERVAHQDTTALSGDLKIAFHGVAGGAERHVRAVDRDVLGGGRGRGELEVGAVRHGKAGLDGKETVGRRGTGGHIDHETATGQHLELWLQTRMRCGQGRGREYLRRRSDHRMMHGNRELHAGCRAHVACPAADGGHERVLAVGLTDHVEVEFLAARIGDYVEWPFVDQRAVVVDERNRRFLPRGQRQHTEQIDLGQHVRIIHIDAAVQPQLPLPADVFSGASASRQYSPAISSAVSARR